LLIQRSGRLQRHDAKYSRPAARLIVFAPPWADEPSVNWLGGPFRRTAAVYPDPGVLWRTARELQRRGAIDVPGEARGLVEAVYGDDAEVPEALAPKVNAAIGRGLATASVADGAVIKLESGYLREGNDWSDEAFTPTRLGEPTTTVRLARADGGLLEPWGAEYGALRWAMSEVRVARRMITRSHPEDAATVASLEADQAFVGDDICTVPLRVDVDGNWSGRALAVRGSGERADGMSVRVTYSPHHGLKVAQGG
jgi:CRISPR-associated endonuclease/helicase Cas3